MPSSTGHRCAEQLRTRAWLGRVHVPVTATDSERSGTSGGLSTVGQLVTVCQLEKIPEARSRAVHVDKQQEIPTIQLWCVTDSQVDRTVTGQKGGEV
jgi:hypothetical protein